MAYADANSTTSKLGTGAAVLLIEGGLAIALITGLAVSMDRTPEKKISTFTIDEPKLPPPPQPEVKQARKDPNVIDQPKTLIELPPVPTAPLTELRDKPGAEGTSDLGDVTFPLPEITPPAPPERPLFKPRAAAPRGNWTQWVTTNDYPASDLRAEHQGTTRYRLTIDATGKVTDCTVTASSGFPGLDRASCDTVKRRAKFEPATDQTGARSQGSFSGSVTWQIPKE